MDIPGIELLSLNIWGGARGQHFLNYIKKRARIADIFCFQEVFESKINYSGKDGIKTNILGELKKILPNYNYVFSPTSNQVHKYFKLPFKLEEGLAIFVKKGLEIKGQKSKHLVAKINSLVDYENGKEAVSAQWVKIRQDKKSFWVINFHGLSRPGNKLDSKARLKQSKDLAKILKNLHGPKILCGDFNLMPETESVKVIERANMANLIKKYKIKNTRNSISWKKYNNRQSFADFTFVSPEIKVKKFKVPYTLVSDHLPMILEFEI